ncbi:signal peptidase I [Enterococcus rivorum]|uniref:signal peptidase I n=1 Tax=Enterococcus rivorum TaxID=762845 RepID=UPI000A0177CC|nr:signal peptidase I [Enterococcus rivorum]MBP2099895.1 signal peptidase I [Enterococcus rivorum]
MKQNKGKSKALAGNNSNFKKKSRHKKSSGKIRNHKRELQNTKTHRLKRVILEIVASIFLGILAILVVGQFFFQIVEVNGYGMVPALRDRDIVLVKKIERLQRFDLVAFKQGNKLQIRRVIGLPGEKIRYEKDTLFINDESIDEKFIIPEINENQKNDREFTEDFQLSNNRTCGVPDDYYFLLGDNRPYAADSRFYGFISKKNIIGVVYIQLSPINEWKSF